MTQTKLMQNKCSLHQLVIILDFLLYFIAIFWCRDISVSLCLHLFVQHHLVLQLTV